MWTLLTQHFRNPLPFPPAPPRFRDCVTILHTGPQNLRVASAHPHLQVLPSPLKEVHWTYCPHGDTAESKRVTINDSWDNSKQQNV